MSPQDTNWNWKLKDNITTSNLAIHPDSQQSTQNQHSNENNNFQIM